MAANHERKLSQMRAELSALRLEQARLDLDLPDGENRFNELNAKIWLLVSEIECSYRQCLRDGQFESSGF